VATSTVVRFIPAATVAHAELFAEVDKSQVVGLAPTPPTGLS